MNYREKIKDKKRIIIKIGSSSITHPETGAINLTKLEILVRELCDIKNMGKDVQWLLLFSDGDKLIEVRFEPDDGMVAAISNRIGTADSVGRGFAM